MDQFLAMLQGADRLLAQRAGALALLADAAV